MAEAISSISRYEVLDARMQPGLAMRSISREHLLLQRHAFEDRLGDDVGLVEAIVGKLRRDQRRAARSISACASLPLLTLLA